MKNIFLYAFTFSFFFSLGVRAGVEQRDNPQPCYTDTECAEQFGGQWWLILHFEDKEKRIFGPYETLEACEINFYYSDMVLDSTVAYCEVEVD